MWHLKEISLEGIPEELKLTEEIACFIELKGCLTTLVKAVLTGNIPPLICDTTETGSILGVAQSRWPQ